MEYNLKNQDFSKKIKTLVSLYLTVVSLFALLSFALTKTVWPYFTPSIHISFQGICLFISIGIFILIWIISDFYEINLIHYQLGIGLLIVAILDIFHIFSFNHPEFISYPNDITIRYWLMARSIEALTLLAAFKKVFNGFIKNKIRNLFIVLAVSGLLIFLSQFSSLFPAFIRDGKFTSTLQLTKWIIVILYIFTLFTVMSISKNNTNAANENDISLILAVLMFISFSLIDAHLKMPINYLIIFGHSLKLCGYCFLLRSVITVSIKQPYKDLNNTRTQLNHILNVLPTGVLGFNKDSRINYANSKALQMLQCDFKCIKNLNKYQCYSLFNVSTDINNTHLTTIKSSSGDMKVLKWYELDTHLGSLNILEDASVEQQLKNLNIQTDIILNAINHLIVIYNKSKEIIYINDKCSKFYGLTNDELIGTTYDAFNNLIQLKHKGVRWDEKSLNNDEYNEYTLVTPRGEEKIIVSNFKKVIGVYDEVIGYVSIDFDVTKVREEQDRVEMQQRLALIGQMGNGIVHESKNYLASIKGYCDLLKLSLEDDRLNSYVDKISYVVNDMNNLVEQYLNLSKPSETILDIVSLNEVIDSVKYVLESPSFLSRTELVINLCKEDEEVLADVAMVQNTVINLAKNAVEAMKDKDNPQLIINTVLRDDNMEIHITDNGSGIAPENLKKLGTPFFTTKKTGTGLGLSNCYKNVQDCGGKIRVQSELGKGTTFIIELPLFEDGYAEENSCEFKKNTALQAN